MQTIFKIVICSMILILNGFKVFSQTYPVTLNTQLIPPYSVYLTDYVSPESEKLFVSVLLNDATIATYNVKLQMTIEGVGIKIQTKPDAYFPPVTITSGMMERLGSAELAPYFDPNNLIFQGITKEQYLKSAALPEGLYKFCIQVIDYNRNVPLSRKECSQAWLVLNDPPRIVSPVCKSIAKVIYPQNLVFQWLPMHLGSPNAAFTTEYHFRLVQIQPFGRNPNDAMLSSPPIYEAVTDNAILYYGISEPQLIPGQQYAWRVQAKDKSGKDLFKNNGYSEVCMFTYGDPCKTPSNIKVEVQSAQKAKVSWDQMFGPSGYKVRYRPHGQNSEWYEEEAFQNFVIIGGLTANKTYDYQVQSICDPAESKYSTTDTFTTKALINNTACGIIPPQINIDKTTSLQALYPNDILIVDGFNVRITEASGVDGKFTGKGVAYIPFLSTYIFTTFKNIKVNSKYEVYEGRVISVRANLNKYKPKSTSPALKNDICQTSTDIINGSEKDKSIKNNEK